MKHEKDSEQLKKLIEAFKNAEKKVGNEFQKSKTSAQLKINVDKQNKTNEFKLLNEVKIWAEKELPEAFQQGYESARKDDDVKGLVPQTTFYDFTQSVLPYIEIGSKVHESVSQYSASINKKIEELEHGEYVTIEKVKNAIMEEVGDMPFIKYANGAKMPLSKYAEMLARTSRIETANGGIVARCKDIKRDLVRYLALPNCCPHCQKFSNKVFSISGQDKRFPYLYGDKGPFREGYNITHPNCRCEIMPFIDELYSDEMDEIIKSSNRLTEFDKNDKMFDNYNKAQARNRQANAELVEYTRLKHTLGKQFPYKTLGSFRRAKHQDSKMYENLKAQARFTKKKLDLDAKFKKLVEDNNGHIMIVNSNKEIKNFSEHCIDRMLERHISNDTFIEILLSEPLKIGEVKYNPYNQPSFEVVYKKITICVNPETGIVTTIHGTHTKLAQKLEKRKDETK